MLLIYIIIQVHKFLIFLIFIVFDENKSFKIRFLCNFFIICSNYHWNMIETENISLNQTIINDLQELTFSKKEKLTISDISHIVYIPCYMGIKIKNFKELSFQNLNAVINLTYKITVKVSGLPKNLREAVIANMIVQMRRNPALKLGNNSQDVQIDQIDQKEGSCEYVSFIVRKFIKVRMEPYVFFTPFEVLDLVASFHLKRQIHTYQHNGQQRRIYVGFNLMERIEDKIQNVVGFTEDGTFANYDLAQRRLCVQFTHIKSSKSLIEMGKNMYDCTLCEGNEIQMEKWQNSHNRGFSSVPISAFAHFHIPLYRFPASVFSTVFIPLWILGVLNLSIFYSQGSSFAIKIDNIANILLAYFVLIGVMNDAIPEQPNITMIEILTYLQIITPFLALVQGLDQRDGQIIDNFYLTATYLISLIITLVVIIIPVIGAISYCVCLYPRHNKKVQRKFKQKKEWTKNDVWGQTSIQQYYKQKRQEQGNEKLLFEYLDSGEFKKTTTEIGLYTIIDEKIFDDDDDEQ